MEDPTPNTPIPQKRPFEEEPQPLLTTPVKAINSAASSPLSDLSVCSPPPPTPPKFPGFTSSAGSIPNSNVPTSSSTQPAKRRKLTAQEKEVQRVEKEAKKAQKEAEDKLKADQRAEKEKERLKKLEERDEKKRHKEEEQRQKEEEKLKKARSQMKLNSFFMKPKDTAGNAGQAVVESTQDTIAPPAPHLPDRTGCSTNSLPFSPQKKTLKSAQSDYERYFLPFNLPAHTILAPKNAFFNDPDKREAARDRFERFITHPDTSREPLTRETLRSTFPRRKRRWYQSATIAEVVERVNGSSERPIDLTTAQDASTQQPQEMLHDIPMRYIHFGEDVRPPYYGTYTKTYAEDEAARLARNPVSRLRKDTNYDYDSEAEWEEPEEGEDLDSDGEDDGDEEPEDDLDGFLDDEEDPQLKRRLISGDLVPVSTGLCWEDAGSVSRLNDGSEAICSDFKEFRMGFLFEQPLQSIDPLSTAYWAPDPALLPPTTSNTSKLPTHTSPMNPPRAPLAQRTMNGLLNTLNAPQSPQPGSATKSTKAKRLIPPEQLPAFKAEIDGKDLTKIGMVEALKKVFPKLPKDAITNTLSVVAARVGPTEKEKRWVLIST